MTDIIQELRGLIAACTKGDLSTAGRHTEAETVECPVCHGDGEVDAADYCNIDGVALGVQFYGIGEQFGALWSAVSAHLPALLDRLEAAERGWQPIETAPGDGTVIDVWRDGTRETVYWGFPPHCCGEMGQYCDSDWHGIKKPGWICSTFGEFIGGKHDPFTHWRPLPSGPAVDGKL